MPDVRGAAAPESVKQTRDKAANAPHPDDPRKPDSPTDMSRPAWFYAAKRAVSEFSKDKVTDLAAGLTFFSVLSLFPMLLAVVSLLGVFGQGERTAETLNEWIAAGRRDRCGDRTRTTAPGRSAGRGDDPAASARDDRGGEAR